MLYFFSKTFSAILTYRPNFSGDEALQLVSRIDYLPDAFFIASDMDGIYIMQKDGVMLHTQIKADPLVAPEAPAKTGLVGAGNSTLVDIEEQKVGDTLVLYLITERQLLILEGTGQLLHEFDLKGLQFRSIAVEGSSLVMSGSVEGVRDFAIELFVDHEHGVREVNRVMLEDRWIVDTQAYEDLMLIVGTHRVHLHGLSELDPFRGNQHMSDSFSS